MSEKKKERNKKRKAILEKEIFRIMNKSLKSAMDMALNDIFKEWK